ncbi:hypothetical protein LVJ94_35120 [Pendulispora rubella]|uniref:Uncharacterized protein n=1 Tax=Pendulispora rubella TaxID=2741070 RepID=A0ABZ2KTU9_9BACT
MARVVVAYMSAKSSKRGAFEEGWSRKGSKECVCYNVGFAGQLPGSDTGYKTTEGVTKLVKPVGIIHDNDLFAAHLMDANFQNKRLDEVILRMVRGNGEEWGKLSMYDVKVVLAQPQWGNLQDFYAGDDWDSLMRTELLPERFDYDFGSGHEKFTASYAGHES